MTNPNTDNASEVTQGDGEFKREERYIVFKRKNLSKFQEGTLRNLASGAGKGARPWPTVECVVVESDWPEYETVWKMIEARVTGTNFTPLEEQLAERDALLRECLKWLPCLDTHEAGSTTDLLCDKIDSLLSPEKPR